MSRPLLFVVFVGALSGCSTESKDTASSTTESGTSESGTTDDTDDTDDPDIPEGTLDEVLPIIEANCLSCHGASEPFADLDLETDFCNTVVDGRLVSAGSTGESLLYRRITSDSQPMPPSGRLDTDVIRPIGVWILNGAPCD